MILKNLVYWGFWERWAILPFPSGLLVWWSYCWETVSHLVSLTLSPSPSIETYFWIELRQENLLTTKLYISVYIYIYIYIYIYSERDRVCVWVSEQENHFIIELIWHVRKYLMKIVFLLNHDWTEILVLTDTKWSEVKYTLTHIY